MRRWSNERLLALPHCDDRRVIEIHPILAELCNLAVLARPPRHAAITLVHQVLGVAADMRANEIGARVARDHVRQRLKDGQEWWEGRAGELPIRVAVQLLPALVGGVERIEERHWVGDVDQHRQIQLAGSRPQRVEPRIVHCHQRAVLIAHV